MFIMKTRDDFYSFCHYLILQATGQDAPMPIIKLWETNHGRVILGDDLCDFILETQGELDDAHELLELQGEKLRDQRVHIEELEKELDHLRRSNVFQEAIYKTACEQKDDLISRQQNTIDLLLKEVIHIGDSHA